MNLTYKDKIMLNQLRDNTDFLDYLDRLDDYLCDVRTSFANSLEEIKASRRGLEILKNHVKLQEEPKSVFPMDIK